MTMYMHVNQMTLSCKSSSKLRLEKQSITATVAVESSCNTFSSDSTTLLLLVSPIISGSDPMISLFKCGGQIDKTWNRFSVNASESTRKSSQRNWFSISLAMSSSRRIVDDDECPQLSLSKYSGSFSSNMF